MISHVSFTLVSSVISRVSFTVVPSSLEKVSWSCESVRLNHWKGFGWKEPTRRRVGLVSQGLNGDQRRGNERKRGKRELSCVI
ncbi:hypothetical protein MHYP_G00203230 [Metynnis hypsauchen]